MTPDRFGRSDLEGLGWSSTSIGDEPLRPNRFPLMRPVEYKRIAILSETGSIEGHQEFAFTINVGNGGMCLLMDWAPEQEEVLRVHVPMPISPVKTPTLAEVRWKRPIPVGWNGLYFVGLKFVL